jgi:hypothetical protein
VSLLLLFQSEESIPPPVGEDKAYARRGTRYKGSHGAWTGYAKPLEKNESEPLYAY